MCVSVNQHVFVTYVAVFRASSTKCLFVTGLRFGKNHCAPPAVPLSSSLSAISNHDYCTRCEYSRNFVLFGVPLRARTHEVDSLFSLALLVAPSALCCAPTTLTILLLRLLRSGAVAREALHWLISRITRVHNPGIKTSYPMGFRSVSFGIGPSPPRADDIAGFWHGQLLLDCFVYELLGKKRGGYYVDLAANDAVSMSNTKSLERDHAWSGLCVEPNPQYHADLLQHRTCKIAAAAVSDGFGQAFFDFRGGASGSGSGRGSSAGSLAETHQRQHRCGQSRSLLSSASMPLRRPLTSFPWMSKVLSSRSCPRFHGRHTT